jgi:hypothetical protein
MNPTQARELLSTTAASSVPPTFTTGDIAGKVFAAFQAALEATQFYQQLKTRATELAAEHWPAVVIALGTAVGTSIGMGIHGNDWRAMAGISERLGGLLNTSIDLGAGRQLVVGLEGSQAIRPTESGVVIGVSPSVGVRWSLGDTTSITIRSRANMRFQTGQDTSAGFGFDWSLTPFNVDISF